MYQCLCVNNNRYFSAYVLLRPGVSALLMLLVTGMPVADNRYICALVLPAKQVCHTSFDDNRCVGSTVDDSRYVVNASVLLITNMQVSLC